MYAGVPAHELAADIVLAGALLLGVCYLPLVLQRTLPGWVQFAAICMAMMLAGGVVFAMTTGHWPFRS